jgi:hypothetical protein
MECHHGDARDQATGGVAVILIGSALLFTFGMLLLLRQTLILAYDLIKLVLLLVAWCGYLLAATIFGCLVLGDKLVRYLRGTPEPEPVITINIHTFDDDNPSRFGYE